MSITVKGNTWSLDGKPVPAKEVQDHIRGLEGKIEELEAETRLHSQQRNKGRWTQRFVGFIAGLLAVILVPLIFSSFGWSFSGVLEGIGDWIDSLISLGIWVVGLLVGLLVGSLILGGLLFGGWKLIELLFKKKKLSSAV